MITKAPDLVDKLRQDIVFTDALLGHQLTFHSTWGLFSPKAIDEGSKLLLRHLEVLPDDRSIDLGCGYGPLGLAIAASSPQGHCTLVDKDFVAVKYAQLNAQINQIRNAEVLLSNGLDQVPQRRFTLAVSNLPAKTGKEHYYLFFHDIHSRLDRGGRLYLVVINGLRSYIARSLTEMFGNHKKIKQGATYTVAMAVKE